MLFMQAGRIDVWNAAKARQAEMDRDDAKEMAALKADEKKKKEQEQEQMAWAIAIVIIVMFVGAIGWGISEIGDMCAKTRCGR
jgi:cell division septal protein FtsQ